MRDLTNLKNNSKKIIDRKYFKGILKYTSIILFLILSLFSLNIISAEDSNSLELPENIVPLMIYADGGKNHYLTTEKSGLFKKSNQDSEWVNISPKIIKRRTTLKDSSQYRKISAFAVSNKSDNILLMSTKHNVYKSYDGGKNWKELKLRGKDITHYYTAVAEDSRGTVYIGSSYKGIYRVNNGRLVNISKGLPGEPYSRKKFFYEGISSLYISADNYLYAGFMFSKGIYRKNLNSKRPSWTNLKIPLKNRLNSEVYEIYQKDKQLYGSTTEGLFQYKISDRKWNLISYEKSPEQILASNRMIKGIASKKDRETLSEKKDGADNKRALYSSIWRLRKNHKKLIKTIKATGLNSIVIDVKDDTGDIFIPVKNKTAGEIKAHRPVKSLKEVLKTFKKNNIYTIARIVVFKDKRLYKAYNSKYAILDSKSKKPWKGNSKEYWVDAFSEFVRNYNIEIAKEAADFGFDEVQFDYIRFPADGSIQRCFHRYKKDKDAYKSEILADFLQSASERIEKPISVDIYGFNGWYKFGNIIGQDIEVFATYVDAVCPMVYPSHFGSSFYKKGPRKNRPYNIVFQSGVRSLALSNHRAIIRPYIQAFDLLSPTWSPDYINKQVKAVSDSKCQGYIFWNAAVDYKMVKKALTN